MIKRIGFLMVFCLAITPSAWAVEALSTAELASHCNKYHDESAEDDRIFCVRYIQGFIDGAVATDERVMRNVASTYGDVESFSKRAQRTRIGSRLKLYGATALAEFCLGEPVQLKEVVEHVVRDTQNEGLVATYPLARSLVYQTLRTQYSCEEAAVE